MSTRLWLPVLCGYFALGATIQALPGLLARGPGTVGLLVTLAAAATAAARPFAGRLADRGRATGVARTGAALVAVGAAAHLVAEGTFALSLARLTVGAGEGALFTGALSRVLEAAASERRGRVIGHFGLSMWGGLACGPPLAALVAAGTTSRGALWLATATAAAALALTAGTTRRRATDGRGAEARDGHGGTRGGGAANSPRSAPHARGEAPHRPAAPAPAAAPRPPVAPAPEAAPRPPVAPAPEAAPPRLLPRAARRPGVVLGLASFGYGAVNAFAVLHAGAGALGVFAGAFLSVRLLGSRLVDDLGPRMVVVASAVLEGGALAALAADFPALVALAVAGASLALVFPALAVWVVEAAAERERAAAVGAMTSCWDVGIAAAGPVGALLVSPGHLEPAFLLAAALAALAALGAALPRRLARLTARAVAGT